MQRVTVRPDNTDSDAEYKIEAEDADGFETEFGVVDLHIHDADVEVKEKVTLVADDISAQMPIKPGESPLPHMNLVLD
jgi:hypothetical protein